MSKWNETHEAKARSQGWSIFNTGDDLEISKIDFPEETEGCDFTEPKFKSDKQAVAFVKRLATQGDPTAQLALKLVK